jgi:hypothetical protein
LPTNVGLENHSGENPSLIAAVLDDNFYTNKTWAEVSGISHGEVHVMEVEFLVSVRYSLYPTEEQWSTWMRSITTFPSFLRPEDRNRVQTTSTTKIFLPNELAPFEYLPPARLEAATDVIEIDFPLVAQLGSATDVVKTINLPSHIALPLARETTLEEDTFRLAWPLLLNKSPECKATMPPAQNNVDTALQANWFGAPTIPWDISLEWSTLGNTNIEFGAISNTGSQIMLWGNVEQLWSDVYQPWPDFSVL